MCPKMLPGLHIRPSPVMRDLAITTLTSVVSTVTAMVTIRLLAEGLGPEQFGAYQLARRALAIVAPIATLSMGVAIPRYVAIARDSTTRDRYYLSGLLLGGVATVIILIGGALFANHLTLLIFHDKVYRLLFLATLCLTAGYSLFTVLYAFYRGLSRMGKANLWLMGTVAIGPLLVALAFAQVGRADLIVALSAVLVGCAGVPLAAHTVRALARSGSRLALRGTLRQMAYYGLPRVPGGFALAGLFAVGPFLAPYFGSLKEAGYLAAGQSVLTALQGGLVAFGLVALPKLAQMVAEGRAEMVSMAVENIVALVLHLGLFCTLQGLLWADEIVLALLGAQYQEAIPLMRVMLLSLVPYLGYVMLRSVVDAVEDRAVNTVSLFIALAVALVVGLLAAIAGLGPMGLAIGSAMGFLTLGASTIYYLARVYRLDWWRLRPRQLLFLNGGFLALGLLAKTGVEASLKGVPLLISVALIVTGMGALYVFGLWRLRVGWLVELEHRILVRPER